MTMVTARHQYALASPVIEFPQPGIRYRVWRSFVRMLVIRHLRQALRAMPDWMLHEIDVARGDIDAVAVRIVDRHDHLSFPRRAHRTGR